MPELPEVETTCKGIEPYLQGKRIELCVVRRRDLRWLVTPGLEEKVSQKKVEAVRRRAKYLIFDLEGGSALLAHLGMSGSLCVHLQAPPVQKHEHIDLLIEGGVTLRYRDPRRFGSWLFVEEQVERHPLLAHLGPEPWHPHLATFLYELAANRSVPVKNLIMDQKVVVGVGNIYASEALFLAKVHPQKRACDMSVKQWKSLVESIQKVLDQAIEAGGTTLNDFVSGQEKPGYFQQKLNVYKRDNHPCPACQTPISKAFLSNRSTYFCPICQKK